MAFPARYENNIVQRAMGLQLALKKSWRTPGVCNLHRSFNRLLICQIFYCPCARCRDTKRNKVETFIAGVVLVSAERRNMGGSVGFPVTHLKLHWSVESLYPATTPARLLTPDVGLFPTRLGALQFHFVLTLSTWRASDPTG